MEITKTYFETNIVPEEVKRKSIDEYALITTRNRHTKTETIWKFRTKFGIADDEVQRAVIYENNEFNPNDNVSLNTTGFVIDGISYPAYNSSDPRGEIVGRGQKKYLGETGSNIRKRFKNVTDVYLHRIEIPISVFNDIDFYNHILCVSIDELSGYGLLHTELEKNVTYKLNLIETTSATFIYSSTIPIHFSIPTNVQSLSFEITNPIVDLPTNNDLFEIDMMEIDTSGNIIIFSRILPETYIYQTSFEVGHTISFGYIDMYIDDESSSSSSVTSSSLRGFINDDFHSANTIHIRNYDGSFTQEISVEDDKSFDLKTINVKIKQNQSFTILTHNEKDDIFTECSNFLPKMKTIINKELINNQININPISTLITDYIVHRKCKKNEEITDTFLYCLDFFELQENDLYTDNTENNKNVKALFFKISSTLKFANKLLSLFNILTDTYRCYSSLVLSISLFEKNFNFNDIISMETYFKEVFLIKGKYRFITEDRNLLILNTAATTLINYFSLIDTIDLLTLNYMLDQSIITNNGFEFPLNIYNITELSKVAERKILLKKFDMDSINMFQLHINTEENSSQLLKDNIQEVAKILNDIIISYDDSILELASNPITIKECEFDDIFTFGKAYWNNRIIEINSKFSGNNNLIYFNNEIHHILVPIILHEVLHILGFGTSESWFNNIHNSYYIGEKGLQNYRKLVQNSSQVMNPNLIIGIPVEDDFSKQTSGKHFEEGINGDYSKEVRVDLNGTVYPVYPEEIMTGFLTEYSFFSCLTAGTLEDIGYGINYSSIYIKNPTLHYPGINTINSISYTHPDKSTNNSVDEIIEFASYSLKSVRETSSFPQTDKMLYITTNDVDLIINDRIVEILFDYKIHSKGNFCAEFTLFINDNLFDTYQLYFDNNSDIDKIHFQKKINNSGSVNARLEVVFYNSKFQNKGGRGTLSSVISPDQESLHWSNLSSPVDPISLQSSNDNNNETDKIEYVPIITTRDTIKTSSDLNTVEGSLSEENDIDFELFEINKKYKITEFSEEIIDEGGYRKKLRLDGNFGQRNSILTLIANEGETNTLINLNLQMYITMRMTSSIPDMNKIEDLK